MRIVTISDTHGKHNNLSLPKGDMIIHAGDISSRGQEYEVLDFLSWYKELDFKYKIFIAGNHDFFFERATDKEIKKMIPDNIIYLCDSEVTIENITIWGSPITPWFYDWAFNRHRGDPIVQHWKLIPSNTDLLITHGPVYNKLDKTTSGEIVGCENLLETVNTIKPKVHVCGHIHEAYGETNTTNTKFINASVLDQNYMLKNRPVIFEL